MLITKFTNPESYAGRWVKATTNDLGFGRCVGRQDDGVLVRYVDVPGLSETTEVVPFGALRLERIPLGTRVWLGASGAWEPGSVIGWAGFDEYRVRSANRPQETRLPASRLVIRWDRPLRDPVGSLSVGLADTPAYYEARNDFFDHLLLQRRLSQGLSGVLSAAVQIYQHQVDVVTRVLGDPVMRYLLADEVGLGKTIEAGLIVRQVLLDDPAATVTVVVPDSLKSQWRAELWTRLLLEPQTKAGRLKLAGFDELLRDGIGGQPDLIVVDEAHRLLAYLKRRPFLRTQLERVHSLLLLSATPMRGDLSTFQQLLNLVDPIAFPIGDLDQFAARVREREEEASALRLLTNRRASMEMRKEVVARLGHLHDSDPTLQRLRAECESSIEPQDRCWRDLSDYVRETYRLSRRMIRHRRQVGPAAGFPVQGRKLVRLEIEDPARPIIDEFLSWVFAEASGFAARDVAALVNASLAGPVTLGPLLDEWTSFKATSQESESDRLAARETAKRLRLEGADARLKAAASFAEEAASQGSKVVVMASSTEAARTFLKLIEGRPGFQVGAHLADTDLRLADDAVDAFLLHPAGAVLVGDTSIEEGRNLQDAHILVNLDLPLDFNQLEQRIGRLDRFSSNRTGAASIVVLDEPTSPWVSAHLRLLDEGLGIFSESVATLQRKLADIHGALLKELPLRGLDALGLNLSDLQKELQYEREEVDLLEEIESISLVGEFDSDVLSELRSYESDPDAIEEAFRRVARRPAGLGLITRPGRRAGTVVFDKEGSEASLGMPRDDFVEISRFLAEPRCFDRSVAVDIGGVSPVRIGDPLVQGIDRILRNDERGRARAWIRPVAGLERVELWLNCEFLVEFDESVIEEALHQDRERLRRRGDALFAPMVIRTWSDSIGIAPDELIANCLAEPYDDHPGSVRRDTSVRGEMWRHVFENLPDWKTLCREAEAVARTHLNATTDLSRACEGALERQQREAEHRLAVLRARAMRLPSEQERASAIDELEREQALGAALRAGIQEPAITLTAAGAVILWPQKT